MQDQNDLKQDLEQLNSVKKLKKRDPFQRESDLVRTSELYLQGKTQAYIAKEMGVSVAQISKDIATIVSRWQKQSIENIEQQRTVQLEKINRIEAEMWTAWENSKTGTTDTTKARSQRGQNTNNRVEVLEKSSHGDISYMNIITWCITERNKILGIYAPKKIAETDVKGNDKVSVRDEILSAIDSIGQRLKKENEDKIVMGEVIDTQLLLEANNEQPDFAVVPAVPEKQIQD